MEKKVRKHINIKGIIIVLLILYLISMLFLYIFKMPVKNIIIEGNKLVSDYDIITRSKLKDYPSLFKYSNHKIAKNILTNDLIDDVTITKTLGGKVTITITENNILFLNRNNNLIVLSNGNEIENDIGYAGPILINYVPNEVYEEFIESFSNVDYSVVNMISEIEYKPLYSNEKIIDKQRFMLRMNDGNEVFINTVNIKQLNNYPSFFATLDGRLGTLNLDSSTSENFVFKPFTSQESEVISSEN